MLRCYLIRKKPSSSDLGEATLKSFYSAQKCIFPPTELLIKALKAKFGKDKSQGSVSDDTLALSAVII